MTHHHFSLRALLFGGAFLLLPLATNSYAGSATWSASPGDGTWSEFAPRNWVPNTVPNGVDDVATFGSSSITAISIVDIDIGAIIYPTGRKCLHLHHGGREHRLAGFWSGDQQRSGMTAKLYHQSSFWLDPFYWQFDGRRHLQSLHREQPGRLVERLVLPDYPTELPRRETGLSGRQ